MSEKLTLGTYPELPIDYPSTFNAIFDVGAGDLAHPHSGYIIDNTMSIIHSASTISQGDQKKIEAIKGWRVIGQNRLDENTPLTEGIIIYINKEDFEATPESFIVSDDKTGSKTPYSSWVLVDTYSTIWENQNVIVEAVDTEPFNLYTLSDDSQGYEMRIKFDPPLSRAPDKIIGIYKPNAMGEGPAPLYGKYEIITGQHRYRAMGNYGNSFGHNSMAQGPYSFAQGQQSVAYGHASHAEGRSSVAAGNFSHSEGESNAAIGTASHASGYQTKAIGYASQTMGFETVAEGDYSFAAGIGTIAKHPYSMAVGEYNTGECPNSCFEVGTGSRAARATGFYVSRNGLCYAPQTTIDNLEAQGDKALVTKEYVSSYSIAKKDQVNYITEQGVTTALVWYNPNAKIQGDILRAQSLETDVYYTQYANNRRFYQCKVTLTFNQLTQGAGGGHYVVFQIDLPNSHILFSKVQINHWGYAHNYSTVDHITDTNKETLTISGWENNIFAVGAYNNILENNRTITCYIECWCTYITDSRYDYNQDGVVDIRDIQILQDYINGYNVIIPTNCITDINNDEKTDSKDVELLEKIIQKYL